MGFVKESSVIWHDAVTDPPKKKGQYLTAYYQAEWDSIDRTKVLVGIDRLTSVRFAETREGWAKCKKRCVVAWAEMPEAPTQYAVDCEHCEHAAYNRVARLWLCDLSLFEQEQCVAVGGRGRLGSNGEVN